MKNKTLIFIILFISFSCGKKIISKNSFMEDTWNANHEGKTYELIITSDSKAVLTISSGLLSYEEYKGMGRIKNDYLYIGFFKKFKINQYPEINNDYNTLTIDGIQYLRKNLFLKPS